MDFDVGHIWGEMNLAVKIITIVMLSLSVLSFYVIVERMLTFGKANAQSAQYVQILAERLRTHEVGQALAAAKQMPKSPVATVMASGLDAFIKGREALEKGGPSDVGNFDVVDSVNRALDRVKERETSTVRKGLPILATVASSAPFIGLLGTVLGILDSFGLIQQGKSIGELSGKIGEALISTAIGLAVAIIAAIAFNFFTTKVERMVVDMNDISSEFIDYVLREGRA
ncbi:MAG: MotA/TolQ/ExbB proton channel family protein [Kofleriaceae bacterium]